MSDSQQELDKIINRLNLIINSQGAMIIQGDNNVVGREKVAPATLDSIGRENLKAQVDQLRKLIEQESSSKPESKMSLLEKLAQVVQEISNLRPDWNQVSLLVRTVMVGLKDLEHIPLEAVHILANIVNRLSMLIPPR